MSRIMIVCVLSVQKSARKGKAQPLSGEANFSQTGDRGRALAPDEVPSIPPIDFLSWLRIISAYASDKDIVRHLCCSMSWLAGLPSGGVLLAPGLLKFTSVNTSRKPCAPVLGAPPKFRLKLFIGALPLISIIGGTAEQTCFSSTLAGSPLVNGTNVLAVEIHQANTM